ncbi:MAG: mechanosensitive ion channel family protein [Candidatus Paceibacterota bacterium]
MESFGAAAILGYMPEVVLNVPLIGIIDLTPFFAALSIFLLLTLLFALLRNIVIERLKILADQTETEVDGVVINAVRSIRPWAYSVVALYASLQFFDLPNAVDLIVRGVFFFTLVWQVIEVILAFVHFGTRRVLEKSSDGNKFDRESKTASDMVSLIARITLWALGGLFLLSNLGIEVTSLIAGLGIGGVAVAFALQGILSDLFASFSIYFDKPFCVGDFVAIGADAGTVEHIGIKSTRIRTLQGEELVVPNAELTNVRVQNYKKMKERRIAFHFGITYETSSDNVNAVNGVVEEIFKAIKTARLDRVHFIAFGDSALQYEVVYHVLSASYDDYLDVQQQFNLELMKKFEEMKIDFAYPTRTLYMRK